MKAVFLDRDGVLNELIYYPDSDEDESPRDPAHLRLIPGVAQSLQNLQNNGWQLFIVSNQPSYAKGKTTLAQLKGVHQHLMAQLTAAGIDLVDAYYSYTHPNAKIKEYRGESVYRKPNPGFLLDAQRDYGVRLSESWMIGDRDSDIECGQCAGTNTALITYPLSRNKQGKTSPDLVCHDLTDFYQRIRGY